MRTDDFVDCGVGEVITTDSTWGEIEAFVPGKLFEVEEQIDVEELAEAHGRTLRELGRIEGSDFPREVSEQTRRQEVVASANVEGIPVSVEKLSRYAAAPHQLGDSDARAAARASGLSAALDERLDSVTLDWIRRVHAAAYSEASADDFESGEFRDVQNFIGRARHPSGARYVPPPPERVGELCEELCEYVAGGSLPPLFRVGLAHYQFEAVHPFPDGNGRVGRVLIDAGLRQTLGYDGPVAPLSEYVLDNRRAYYDRLLYASQRGALTEWLEFFFDALTSALKAVRNRGGRLVDMRDQYDSAFDSGRHSTHAAVLHESLGSPHFTVSSVADAVGVHYNTANRVVGALEEEGYVEEVTGNQRGRVFCNRDALRL